MIDGLPKDEKMLLETYRRARDLRFSDIQVSVEDGRLVKLFLTEKKDPAMLRALVKETT